jgi:hypothetical protein
MILPWTNPDSASATRAGTSDCGRVFVVGESAARAVASRRRERGLHELSGVTIIVVP